MLIAAGILALVVAVWCAKDEVWPTAILAIAVALICAYFIFF
jgi:hypothetical protein